MPMMPVVAGATSRGHQKFIWDGYSPATMRGEPRRLQASDGGPFDVEPVVRALGRRFAVTPGTARVVQRTRLDTFDRRLRAAGLSLEHDATRGDRILVLDRPGGTSATQPVSGLRFPALADALPAGPVRDQVAEVAGVRALMVIDEEKRRVRRIELRNGDGKTVVRLEVDEPAGRQTSRPATVTVRELRGYGDQASRAVGLLTGLGLRAAIDVDESGAEVTAPKGVDRDAPALDLLAPSLTGFLQAINDNLPGLLADVDTEFLHDLRVAVRRTRATLKLGRRALPDELRSRWEPEFKWLGDLTTPVRDLDVYELDLPAMGGWLVAADASDLAPFAVHLRRRRSTERRALLRGLRSTRFERLRSEWGETLAALAGSGGSTVHERGDPDDGRRARRPSHHESRSPGGAWWCGSLLGLPGHRPACAAEAVQGAPVRARGVRTGARPRGSQARRGRPQGPAARARSVPGHRGAAAGPARVRRGDDGRRHLGRGRPRDG